MTDLKNLKADFRDWLTLPQTKTFMEILTHRANLFLDTANTASSQTYHKKEKDEQITLFYGKADGIKTILALMVDCKEEEPEIKTVEGEEVKTYPTIDELFQQTFEPEND